MMARAPARARVRTLGCGAAAALALVALVAAGPVLDAASRTPVRARHAMVGSTDLYASRVGLAVLRDGGNAIDAAVAMGFALAVTHPAAGNLGGGGFMVIRFADGRETTIDYRETAPGAAHRDMFLDEAGAAVAERSRIGPLAAGVPGSVAGLAFALERYGSRPLSTLLAPAIALARDGIDVSWALSDSLQGARARLSRFPASAAAYLRPDGSAPAAGDRLVQPDLARTLSLIADRGADAFYRGPIATLIADEMRRTGGLISEADLAAYRPIERPPVAGTYRGLRVISMGPPSSGGIALIQLLNILEGFPIAEMGHNASATMHVMVEAMRRVYADRAEWLGDPAYVQVPTSGLVSKAYAEAAAPGDRPRAGDAERRDRPRTPARLRVDGDDALLGRRCTGHRRQRDDDPERLVRQRAGGAGAGFLLNNEMDDFSAKPGAPNLFGLLGGTANAVAPGKRMLSSMTPTIVVRDDRTWLVLGSPGGGRIITTVLQVLVNMVDHGMDVQEAVDAPRFHHQWYPDEVRLERRGFSRDVVTALEARGHVTRVAPNSGDVHAIIIDRRSGLLLGASDPRLDGVTLGF
jgi:gamma-glutamyltranspeptidase / glutathione hydrolase